MISVNEVTHCVNDFLSLKNVTSDTDIASKYKTLFEKYECFSNIIKINYVKKPITINPNRKPKDINRTITGILNILNHNNYNKIFAKLRLSIQADNIVYIMNEILNKSIIQIFFIDIYTKLILDIVNIYHNKKILFDIMHTFLSNYLVESNFDIPEDSIEYNDFCYNQKRKLNIISTNKVVLNLIKSLNLIDIKDYARFIDNIIINPRLHVLVPIITDIVKYGYKDFNNLHLLTKDDNISQKTKFMINDMLELIF